MIDKWTENRIEEWQLIGDVAQLVVERLRKRIQTPATAEEVTQRSRAERTLVGPPMGGAAQEIEYV